MKFDVGERFCVPDASVTGGTFWRSFLNRVTLGHVTPESKADIEITGDAFSAYGMRKGNLVSCRARVELKAQKRTGEIVAVDRETSAAVDLTEQTAAKLALQDAAATLAERLLPKLAR